MVDIITMVDVILSNPGLVGLLVFGNIENLVLASQGVVAGVDSKKLLLFSVIIVIMWISIGTVCTSYAIQYSNIIEFIGGLAIFILGIQSMVQAILPYIRKNNG